MPVRSTANYGVFGYHVPTTPVSSNHVVLASLVSWLKPVNNFNLNAVDSIPCSSRNISNTGPVHRLQSRLPLLAACGLRPSIWDCIYRCKSTHYSLTKFLFQSYYPSILFFLSTYILSKRGYGDRAWQGYHMSHTAFGNDGDIPITSLGSIHKRTVRVLEAPAY
jgi:hypothetical protein